MLLILAVDDALAFQSQADAHNPSSILLLDDYVEHSATRFLFCVFLLGLFIVNGDLMCKRYIKQRFCEETGRTKTKAVEMILSRFFEEDRKRNDRSAFR